MGAGFGSRMVDEAGWPRESVAMKRKSPPTLQEMVEKKLALLASDGRRIARERRDLERALEMIKKNKLPPRENRGFTKYEPEFLAESLKYVRFPFPK